MDNQEKPDLLEVLFIMFLSVSIALFFFYIGQAIGSLFI